MPHLKSKLLRHFSMSMKTVPAVARRMGLITPLVAQVPHLRDFSKAPFLIGALACLGVAVLRPHRPSANRTGGIIAD
jgi:hypothetical protein